MQTKIDKAFFARETSLIAIDLIGKLFIVTDAKSGVRFTTRIVETEAYRTNDPASHSARGWTQRCAPMFEEPARTYVYFIYGMYKMINFVTEPNQTPGAVLIRALEPLKGFGKTPDLRALSGPGKLCRELAIEMGDNRKSVLRGRFRIEDDGNRPAEILITPRVGIREDEPFKPLRYLWKGHPAVSRAPQNKIILGVIHPDITESMK